MQLPSSKYQYLRPTSTYLPLGHFLFHASILLAFLSTIYNC